MDSGTHGAAPPVLWITNEDTCTLLGGWFHTNFPSREEPRLKLACWLLRSRAFLWIRAAMGQLLRFFGWYFPQEKCFGL